MAYRKTPATAARMEARRRVILEAAMRLFGSRGYHETTVPMIVAAAASSTGSFYSYFRNKEDVFVAVLEESGKNIGEVLVEAKSKAADSAHQISDAVEALFLYLAANPLEAHILMVESFGLNARMEQVGRAITLKQVELVRTTLEDAPEAFATENTTVAARCLVGGVCEALRNWMEQSPETRLSALEMARAVGDFSVRAVRR